MFPLQIYLSDSRANKLNLKLLDLVISLCVYIKGKCRHITFLAEKETHDGDDLAKGSEMSNENITGAKCNDSECHMFYNFGSLMFCTHLRQLSYLKGFSLCLQSQLIFPTEWFP